MNVHTPPPTSTRFIVLLYQSTPQPIYVIQPCFERAYKESVYVQRKLLVLNITKQRWKCKFMIVIDMSILEDGMKWR